MWEHMKARQEKQNNEFTLVVKIQGRLTFKSTKFILYNISINQILVT